MREPLYNRSITETSLGGVIEVHYNRTELGKKQETQNDKRKTIPNYAQVNFVSLLSMAPTAEFADFPFCLIVSEARKVLLSEHRPVIWHPQKSQGRKKIFSVAGDGMYCSPEGGGEGGGKGRKIRQVFF